MSSDTGGESSEDERAIGSRWQVPGPSAGRPDYDDRLTLYRQMVDEYRFQVQLNWDRAKYLIGFNTAVFAAGVGLLKLSGTLGRVLVAGVFLIGLVGCAFAATATRTQHAYYVVVRNRMVALGNHLGLGDAAVATTPGAQNRQRTALQRLARVQSLTYGLLLVTGVADALGVAYVLAR